MCFNQRMLPSTIITIAVDMSKGIDTYGVLPPSRKFNDST